MKSYGYIVWQDQFDGDTGQPKQYEYPPSDRIFQDRKEALKTLKQCRKEWRGTFHLVELLEAHEMEESGSDDVVNPKKMRVIFSDFLLNGRK